MNIGMLWFDNDPKVNLDTKIERAAIYYAKKYGKNPTLCFVHPSMLGNPASQERAPGKRGHECARPAEEYYDIWD